MTRRDLLGLVAAFCGLALAVGLFREPLLREAWPRVAPSVGRLGVEVPATPGFTLRVLSSTPGATVWIDGVERGGAPFFGNAACREGEEVTIEVRAPGRPPWVRKVACREGGTLEVTAR